MFEKSGSQPLNKLMMHYQIHGHLWPLIQFPHRQLGDKPLFLSQVVVWVSWLLSTFCTFRFFTVLFTPPTLKTWNICKTMETAYRLNKHLMISSHTCFGETTVYRKDFWAPANIFNRTFNLTESNEKHRK